MSKTSGFRFYADTTPFQMETFGFTIPGEGLVSLSILHISSLLNLLITSGGRLKERKYELLS